MSRSREAAKERSRKWYRENLPRAKRVRTDRFHGEGAYDWKVARFLDINSCCEICGVDLETHTKAHLDHDHSDGRWRGLLCMKCNVNLLGNIERTAARMETSVEEVLLKVLEYTGKP